VLEIGCGHGDDTATLAGAGLQVLAFDLSRVAVGIARARVPSATIECRDLRDPFPGEAHELGVVVASLSLHYFVWAETIALAERIRTVLRPGGVLLCRLNSTEDKNFGAHGRHEIEPNYFMVDGSPKRFFDESSVRSLFAAGWHVLAIEHFTTRKYVKAKSLWEVVVEREP
jgi:SAM-dependent methyltransferase